MYVISQHAGSLLDKVRVTEGYKPKPARRRLLRVFTDVKYSIFPDVQENSNTLVANCVRNQKAEEALGTL